MRESHREHRSAQGGLMSLLAQITAYIVSPLATLLAVWVAYLALSRNSQPQLLAYYQPNPDVPSVIDLVVENIGGGSAIEVRFSEPLPINRSEEHTSELQSLMRISYAVFCLKKKKHTHITKQ